MQNSESCNVQVFCRFRPFNDQETNLPNHKFVEIQPSCQSVVVHPFRESHEKVQFNYDYVFPSSSTQQFVYDTAARPIVESVMHGFNGTVFAFGQTSSGKTYTMTGLNEDHTDLLGIIPRMITTVFYHIENSDDTIEYTVKVSYFELYLEKIKDLLDISKTNLKIREDKVRGIYLEGLTELYVSTGEEVHEFMKYGNVYRTVGAHRMNNESSRSHSIFSITITQNNLIDYSTKTGKLHLIDLAGSEKVEKTGAEGTRLEEAKKINKSLTTLGIVITALSENRKGHIPYRDSKLTRILQDSLGGNSKTSLIITCSPSSFNEVETISSLRFGARAKLIKNTPKVNIELTVGELKLLLAEAKDELRQADRKLQKYENNAKIENQSPQISQESVSLIYESDIDTKYSDVLKELEDTRSRLNAEISINFKLRQELSISNQSNTDLKSEYDLLLSHTRLIDDEFISLEHLLKQKEEIIENLTIFKDKYENEFLANSENYLKLQQVIVEKDLEVEILRRKIKTNFDVNDLSKSQQEKIILGKYAPSITQLNSEISVSSEST